MSVSRYDDKLSGDYFFLFIEKRFYTKIRFLIKQILPAEVLRKSCENTIFIALNLIANQSTMKNGEIERQGQILIAFIHSDISCDLRVKVLIILM